MDFVAYLGTRRDSVEHYVAGDDGEVRCARTVRRVGEDRRWDLAAIRGVEGVPEDPGRARGAAVEPAEASVIPAPAPAAQVRRPPKSFHIKIEDQIAHGYTAGCPRRNATRTCLGGAAQHSATRRERFRKIFAVAVDPRVERARRRRRVADGASTAAAPRADADLGVDHGVPPSDSGAALDASRGGARPPAGAPPGASAGDGNGEAPPGDEAPTQVDQSMLPVGHLVREGRCQ